MPPNDMSAMYRVDQALRAVPKGLDVILMGDLNVQIRDPHDNHEEDLETALSNRGMFSMKDHAMPQRRYRGSEIWTWSMQR